MANEEHLAILNQGIEAWNRWRKENPEVKPDLSGANLSNANLRGIKLSDTKLSRANLRGVDLRDADLISAKLISADLSNANLQGASLSNANLINANLINANLSKSYLGSADFRGVDLRGADLRDAESISADFNGADLRGANLNGANFNGADLSRVHLNNVDLSNTNLSRIQALGANFSHAMLTGACIEDWNINSYTNFQDVTCEYIFTGYNNEDSQFTDRRPHDPNKVFASGEFAALIQKSQETVDLIFVDGINWKAFFLSFQQLQEKYRDENLSIQAIEKKADSAFVIRLEVDPRADKAAIEQDSKSFYESQLKSLETQYQEMLRLQGDSLEDARRTIEYERQEKATLMGIVTTLANNQGPRNDFRGARFGGGVAIDGGTQTGGTLNNFSDEQDSGA